MSNRTVKGDVPSGGSGFVVSTALSARFVRGKVVVVVVVVTVVAGGAVVVVVFAARVVGVPLSLLFEMATAVPATAAPAAATPRTAPAPMAPPAAKPAGMAGNTATVALLR